MASDRGKRTILPPKRYRTEDVVDNLEDFDSGSDLDLDLSSSNEEPVSSESSDSDSDSDSTPRPGPSTSTPGASVNEWIEATTGFKTSSNFRFLPVKPCGVQQGLLPDQCAEMDVFNLIFTEQIIGSIVAAINAYGERRVMMNNPPKSKRSRFATWEETTPQEVRKLLATLMLMNIDKKSTLKDYFSSDSLHYQPIFSQLFKRERFLILYESMLHTGNPEAVGKEKIEPFVKDLCDRFSEVFGPGQHLSIDEMIVGYKGRWKYRQFNAAKPQKYHIKSFALVDSVTGYVLNILTYYGSDTSYSPQCDPDGGHAKKIFQTLLQVVGSGHHVYADRYYTTRELVDDLTEKRTYYTGTVQTNRRNFPPQIKSDKLQHMDAKFYRSSDDKLLCISFKDKKAKKPVILVTNGGEAERSVRKGKDKPSVVHQYNSYMNGCDKAGQNVRYYGMHLKRSKKWWKKLFLWAIEIGLLNAFVLFKLSHSPTERDLKTKRFSFKGFKEALVHGLIAVYKEAVTQPEPVLGMALPGRPQDNDGLERTSKKRHIIVYTPHDRRCKHCPKRTGFICGDCEHKPHLHPKECFAEYHKHIHD